MKSQPVTVSLMGMPEAERRVLVSAVTTVLRSGVLPRELAWAAPAEADLLIVGVDDAAATQQADAYDHLWPRERIGYGPRGLDGVSVSRPLKVQALIDALAAALHRIEARAQAPDPTPVPAPVATPVAAAATPAAPRTQRVYRGQTY